MTRILCRLSACRSICLHGIWTWIDSGRITVHWRFCFCFLFFMFLFWGCACLTKLIMVMLSPLRSMLTFLYRMRIVSYRIIHAIYQVIERYGATLSEDWIHVYSFLYLVYQVVAVCVRRSRCSCTSRRTVCQQPVFARFLSQPLFLGTLCQMMCNLHRLSLPSGDS